MKNLFLTLCILLFSYSLFAQSGSINVTITKVENSLGVIKIGLYNNAESYPDDGKEYKGEEIKAAGEDVVDLLENIACIVYHSSSVKIRMIVGHGLFIKGVQ